MDFDDYERLIEKQITNYEKGQGKATNLYKKAKKQLDLYQIHLIDNMAADNRMQWLQQRKQKLNKIKQQKMIVKDEVQIQKILDVGEDVQHRLKDIMKDTQQAIKVSTYIRIQLQKQIQLLDQLQDQNKQFNKRIKKVKKGLLVIIRRAMLNKITRFLMVLVILAVIGLVVVSILKDNGKI